MSEKKEAMEMNGMRKFNLIFIFHSALTHVIPSLHSNKIKKNFKFDAVWSGLKCYNINMVSQLRMTSAVNERHETNC